MKTVVELYEEVTAEIDRLQKQKAELHNMLTTAYEQQIKEQLANKDYGAGTVTVDLGEKTIKLTYNKKVTWDGDRLRELYKRIEAGNENPDEYIEVRMTVPENKFKNWPTAIQESFVDARTVEVTGPTIKIEAKK